HVLLAGVEALDRGPDGDLPPGFVEVEHHPAGRRLAALSEGRLRRAVEGIPDRLLDAVEIRDAGLRPRVTLQRRIAVLVRVRVEAELVHQRLRPLARAVGDADIVEEVD